MKRATAINHLVGMAHEATDQLEYRGRGELGWPLEELWVTGALLGFADPIEVASVVLVLDLEPARCSWLAVDPVAERVGELLDLRRRPVLWWCRPAVWPVWNHQHPRLVRFWSATDGLDTSVIDALRSRRLDGLDITAPTPEVLRQQVEVELDVSRRHLRSTLESYHDRDWRRAHTGYHQSPEDHLWRAATAVSDMLDTRAELASPARDASAGPDWSARRGPGGS